MRKLAQRILFPVSLLITILGSVMALRHGVQPTLIPLVATIAFLAIVMVGERLLPRIGRPAETGELWADVGFVGLTSIIDPLANGLVAGLVILLASVLPTNALAEIPLWAGTLGVLLVKGFGDYWAHRLGHEWSWWWKLHAVHHAPHRMVALNNLRLHPLDLTLKVGFKAVPVLLFGFSPEALALAGAIVGLNVAFQHADIDLRHGYLNYVMSTNSVHRWHHSNRAEQANANYGSTLILFDLLFGTYNVPAEELEPVGMGLFEEKQYPVHSVWRSILAPFCWHRFVDRE